MIGTFKFGFLSGIPFALAPRRSGIGEIDESNLIFTVHIVHSQYKRKCGRRSVIGSGCGKEHTKHTLYEHQQ
jgi:hypothetical protein